MILDNTPPTIGGQGNDTTIQCIAGMPAFTPPTAVDNCDPNPTIQAYDVYTAGSCPQAYSITRFWFAMDACGNISDTVSQTINVIDNIRPTVSGQGANATIQCTQTPVFSAPTASDNCDPNPSIRFVRYAWRHTLRFNLNLRHWYAVDACGNVSDTVSQTITVVDTTPPTIRHTGENHFY